MFSFFTCVVLTEALVALVLASDLPPISELLIQAVTALRRKGSPALLIVRSLSFVTAAFLFARIHGIYKIRRRIRQLGSPTSADHFILRTYLLEAFLMGSSLFFIWVIRSLHHAIIQTISLKTELETLEVKVKHVEAQYSSLKTEKSESIERERANARKEITALKDVVAELREQMENLLLESLEKDKAIRSAEKNALALRRQTEGLSLEYHRLLDDNESLRDQLASFERQASHSGAKKHS